jgi:hypothetical protein
MATPYNFPAGTTNAISFGPARVAITTGLATPNFTSHDVGYIGEDGVSIEITSEKKDITQGNPKLVEYSFTQAQSVKIGFTSIQWDVTNFARASGGTEASVVFSSTSTISTFGFGGDPLNDKLSMLIQHQQAIKGYTMNIYAWQVMSESGFNIPFGQDEHQFEYNFKVIRSATDWGSIDLDAKMQLIKVEVDRTP